MVLIFGYWDFSTDISAIIERANGFRQFFNRGHEICLSVYKSHVFGTRPPLHAPFRRSVIGRRDPLLRGMHMFNSTSHLQDIEI